MGYANKIYYQYPTAIPDDFTLQDDSDGQGVKLTYWNTAKLGAKPTIADLDAIDDIVSDNAALNREAENAINTNKKDRLIFEINYDQENRVRILEGKVVITKQQYKDALIVKYKAL